MTELLSFHNDPLIKEKYLTRLKKHHELDEFIKGKYWENGKGCAVGCTVHSGNHKAYEDELGVPLWLAYLEDKIFEGLENDKAKDFAVNFLEAIPVGKNLNPIKHKFFAFLLKENIERVLTLKISDELKTQVVDSIRGVLALHETAIETEVWPRSAAQSASWAAESAARAAWAARAARAAWAAAAAWAAWAAARAAWAAAAARAAWAAAESAWAAAESATAAYDRYAEELLRLLREV